MIFTRTPLDKMRLTQPYGVDYVGSDFYSKIGLNKGHNGWDLSAPNGTPCYAVADGIVEADGNLENDKGYGLNARLFIPLSGDAQLECVYAHLQKVTKTGEVKMGEQIGECDNSGYSTGPHLHFGVRMRIRDGLSWQVMNYDNGYYGYLNPAQFFPTSLFELPVDRRYGNSIYTPGVPSDLKFYATNVWFWRTFKRLMTTRERHAFQFGFWDLRTVLDPAMFVVWSEHSKPEAQKLGLIK